MRAPKWLVILTFRLIRYNPIFDVWYRSHLNDLRHRFSAKYISREENVAWVDKRLEEYGGGKWPKVDRINAYLRQRKEAPGDSR